MTTLASIYQTHHNTFLTSKASSDADFNTAHEDWMVNKKDLCVVSLINLITVDQTHISNMFKVESVTHEKRWIDIKTILPSVMSATDKARLETVDACPRNCRLPEVLKDTNANSLLVNAKCTLVNFKIVNDRLQVFMRMTLA